MNLIPPNSGELNCDIVCFSNVRIFFCEKDRRNIMKIVKEELRMNNIVGWCLRIIINASAFLCAVKSKSKVIHIILECIYCGIILALPVFFISFFISAMNGNENIEKIITYMSCILGGSLLYFVISNRESDKRIEDYMLLGLYM